MRTAKVKKTGEKVRVYFNPKDGLWYTFTGDDFYKVNELIFIK